LQVGERGRAGVEKKQRESQENVNDSFKGRPFTEKKGAKKRTRGKKKGREEVSAK